jgi:hypothetical protein
MGISIDGKGWGCWRRSDHRGRSPVRLVQALIGCSDEQARHIVGYTSSLIPDDFFAQVSQALSPSPEPALGGTLSLPDEFRPLSLLPSARPYIAYLQRRGFDDPVSLSPDYGLCYCTRGPYHGRIIFPIYHESKLMSWSARSIYPTEPMRYKVLSTRPERAEAEGYEQARGASSHYLLFFDILMKSTATTLYVCEGPFDALKIMVLGRGRAVATCLFTNSPTLEQVDLLYELVPRFENRHLLLDRDMFFMSVKVSSDLSGLELIPTMLPEGVKDPGELTAETFSALGVR